MERIAPESPSPSLRGVDLRFIGVTAVAIAMVWSSWIFASTYHTIKVKPQQRTIRVTGSAKKRIVSDLIEWTATVEARAPDRTTAYKTLHSETDRTIAFLKQQGIKEDEIQPQSTVVTEDIEVQEELKKLPGDVEATKVEKKIFKGYITTQAIRVQSKDVQRVEKASREVTSLLEEGLTITSSTPSYFYT